jgi:hypothetical protein
MLGGGWTAGRGVSSRVIRGVGLGHLAGRQVTSDFLVNGTSARQIN